jgi:nucleoside-diphosphate-sugar epimerase
LFHRATKISLFCKPEHAAVDLLVHLPPLMRILLTGPTGFIGSTFTRLALSRGHQLAGLVIPSEAIPAHLPANPQLTWLRGTLAEAPWAEIAAFGPDVCVHTAWITTPGVYLESPENDRFRDDSLDFIRKLRQQGTNRIFALGTCIEYRITNQPLSEDTTPIAPTTRYTRAKDSLRLALEAEARENEFCIFLGSGLLSVRPGRTPGQTMQFHHSETVAGREDCAQNARQHEGLHLHH